MGTKLASFESSLKAFEIFATESKSYAWSGASELEQVQQVVSNAGQLRQTVRRGKIICSSLLFTNVILTADPTKQDKRVALALSWLERTMKLENTELPRTVQDHLATLLDAKKTTTASIDDEKETKEPTVGETSAPQEGSAKKRRRLAKKISM